MLATITALSQLKSPEEVARLRGKCVILLLSSNFTVMSFFMASSLPLRIASGISAALPIPASQLKSPEEVARLRGKSVEEILG